MIFCFIIDNGLNSRRPVGEDQVTFLDLYKTTVEIFVRMKQREMQNSKLHISNCYLLLTTSSSDASQLTTIDDSLATLLDKVKTIEAGGWSNWDATFHQLAEYLSLIRLSTMQDTIGQGNFMSMVNNCHIFILTDRVPQLIGVSLASKMKSIVKISSEIESCWLSLSDRSDTVFHLTCFSGRPQSAIDDFRKSLNVKKSKILLHSFSNALEIGEKVAFLQQSSAFLYVSLFFKIKSLSILVMSTSSHSGFWCFPETLEFLRIMCSKKSKLSPRPNFLSIWCKSMQSNVNVPEKFPIDQFAIEVERERILEFFELQEDAFHMDNSLVKNYELTMGLDEEEKSFGFLQINSNSCSMTLLPWDYAVLFEILNSTSDFTSDDFLFRLFTFINTKVPKNYINPLKSALKYFGIPIMKFPYVFDEGYLPECLSTRANLSNTAKKVLQDFAISLQTSSLNMPLATSVELPTSEALHLFINHDNINEKYMHLSRNFFAAISNGYQNMLQSESKCYVQVGKMSDFYKNLEESLKIKNPYEDDSEREARSISIFSNPFRRKRKATEKDDEKNDKKGKLHTLCSDANEDDEFAAAIKAESFPSSTSVGLDAIELAEQNIASESTAEHIIYQTNSEETHGVFPLSSTLNRALITIVKNPGDTIEQIRNFLHTNNICLSNADKEMLISEATKFRKDRLIKYLQNTIK